MDIFEKISAKKQLPSTKISPYQFVQTTTGVYVLANHKKTDETKINKPWFSYREPSHELAKYGRMAEARAFAIRRLIEYKFFQKISPEKYQKLAKKGKVMLSAELYDKNDNLESCAVIYKKHYQKVLKLAEKGANFDAILYDWEKEIVERVSLFACEKQVITPLIEMMEKMHKCKLGRSFWTSDRDKISLVAIPFIESLNHTTQGWWVLDYCLKNVSDETFEQLIHSRPDFYSWEPTLMLNENELNWAKKSLMLFEYGRIALSEGNIAQMYRIFEESGEGVPDVLYQLNECIGDETYLTEEKMMNQQAHAEFAIVESSENIAKNVNSIFERAQQDQENSL